MFGSKEKVQLAQLKTVLVKSQRGIYKRIDENRELLQLLKNEVPDFLERNFWVESWIQSQDDFLLDILKVMPLENSLNSPIVTYPRPWPGNGIQKD